MQEKDSGFFKSILKQLSLLFWPSFSSSKKLAQALQILGQPPLKSVSPPMPLDLINLPPQRPSNNGSTKPELPFYEAASAMLVVDESSGGPPALKPYLDTEGYWTIGHGFLLGRKIQDIRISHRVAMAMLEDKITEALEGAIALWGKDFYLSLDRPRQLGLLNLVYNLGQTKLKEQFKQTVPAIARRDWAKVRQLLRAAEWYRDVKPNRAERVIAAICDGRLAKEYTA